MGIANQRKATFPVFMETLRYQPALMGSGEVIPLMTSASEAREPAGNRSPLNWIICQPGIFSSSHYTMGHLAMQPLFHEPAFERRAHLRYLWNHLHGRCMAGEDELNGHP